MKMYTKPIFLSKEIYSFRLGMNLDLKLLGSIMSAIFTKFMMFVNVCILNLKRKTLKKI